jgi:uncharacterized protein YegJ (DUF2314 family)
MSRTAWMIEHKDNVSGKVMWLCDVDDIMGLRFHPDPNKAATFPTKRLAELVDRLLHENIYGNKPMNLQYKNNGHTITEHVWVEE